MIRHGSGPRKARIDNDQCGIIVVFASIAQRKPTGCASAAFPPITTTTLAFLISTQWLVMAPRPNVGARLATVGPCQTRAWLSTASIPRERVNFWVNIPFRCWRQRRRASRGQPAVYRGAFAVFLNEVGITVGFHQTGDTLKSVIPADALPFIRARARYCG